MVVDFKCSFILNEQLVIGYVQLYYNIIRFYLEKMASASEISAVLGLGSKVEVRHLPFHSRLESSTIVTGTKVTRLYNPVGLGLLSSMLVVANCDHWKLQK